MTKEHILSSYKDGFATISFCKRCSAEGEKLIEPCPGKVLDEKKQTSK